MVLTTGKPGDGKMNPQITKSRKLVIITEEGDGLVICKKKVKAGDLAVIPNLQANKFVRLGWAREYHASAKEYALIQAEVEMVLSETQEHESGVIQDAPVPDPDPVITEPTKEGGEEVDSGESATEDSNEESEEQTGEPSESESAPKPEVPKAKPKTKKSK